MKKTLLLAFAVFLCTANAKAENRVEKFGVFDHVSIGITAFDILNGWGFEAAAPITDFVQFRAGYVFLPKFHYTTDFEYNKNDGTTGDVPVKFQLNKGLGTNWKHQ